MQFTRSLRFDKDALRSYVHQIPTQKYKDILKCHLDADIFVIFLEVLQHDVYFDPAWCRSCLSALEQVDRFSMVSSLVPKVKQNELKAIRLLLAEQA